MLGGRLDRTLFLPLPSSMAEEAAPEEKEEEAEEEEEAAAGGKRNWRAEER